MTIRTIDITPSWREVAQIIEIGLTCGTSEGQKMARDELAHMAIMLDKIAAEMKGKIDVTNSPGI